MSTTENAVNPAVETIATVSAVGPVGTVAQAAVAAGYSTEVAQGLQVDIERIIARYPAGKERSALIPMLHLVQSVDGYVSPAGIALCAARLGLERADQASLDDWDRMIDTNIRGLATLTRLLLPQMVRRNRGYVINIGSIAGDWPYPGGNVYGATKAFVKQFSQNLRADLAGTAIRVSNVEPGLCGGTEFSNVRFKGDDERAASVYAGVQAISPEDIARIVLWLVQQPPHVNVNRIEVMPVAQSFAPLSVARG